MRACMRAWCLQLSCICVHISPLLCIAPTKAAKAAAADPAVADPAAAEPAVAEPAAANPAAAKSLEQVCAQCIRNAPQLCPPFPLAWDSNLLLHSTGGCALRSDGSAFSVAPAGTGVCAMYSQRPSNFPPFPSCLGFTPAASLNRRLCPGSVRAELLPPAWLCPPSIPHLWCIIFHGPAGHRRSACCCGAPGRWAS